MTERRQLLDYLRIRRSSGTGAGGGLTGSRFLAKKITHIKEIVAMQQNYAKSFGILESLSSIDCGRRHRMNIGSMEAIT